MRARRFLPALLTLVVVLSGSLFVAVPSVFAADTTNYAGRPIGGPRVAGGTVYSSGAGFSGQCLGTMYGKDNGNWVLFTARHCFSSNDSSNWAGASIIGSLGISIGNVANCDHYNGMSAHDMCFIWLNANGIPSGDKNCIWAGTYCDLNAQRFGALGNDDLFGTQVGDNLVRHQQEVVLGSKPTVWGPITGLNSTVANIHLTTNNCLGTGIDSGTPWTTGGDNIAGVGSSSYGPVCWQFSDRLTYDTIAWWRPGIVALDNWVNTNYGGRAYFCADPDCTAP